MPSQPSPGKDDGCDISDYYGVDPRYGIQSRSCLARAGGDLVFSLRHSASIQGLPDDGRESSRFAARGRH
jgi:hypothetical protein